MSPADHITPKYGNDAMTSLGGFLTEDLETEPFRTAAKKTAVS